MRMTIPAALGALILVAATAPVRAGAQEIPSPYTYLENKQEVGPFIGYRSAAQGRFGYGPKGGTLTGARWGIELAGPLSFEGVAGLMRGERDVVNPARDLGDQLVGTADVQIATIDARLKFSLTGARAWHGISPFIVFGGGIAFDTADDDPIESDLLPADRFNFGSSFFGTLGGGTRWFLTERIALRADAIFSLWRLDTPPGFSDPERPFENVEESEWARGLGITISGLWRW